MKKIEFINEKHVQLTDLFFKIQELVETVNQLIEIVERKESSEESK